MAGCRGKFLDVNLSDGQLGDYSVNNSDYKMYLGGIGVNARILYEMLAPGIDALDDKNILVFSTGTLVGSNFPTACRTEVSAKSPLTNRFGTSNSGMFFGGHLRKAGYDGIILRGRSSTPVYILIDNNNTEIMGASDLWGKDTWDTLDLLENKYPGAEFALIGTAGENGVRFASLQNGRYDAWGRTGMGAVMGSKNLKAIVVRGGQKITAVDPERFKNISRKANKQLRTSPFFEPFKKYGTMNASQVYNKYEAFPAHNFTRGSLPGWNDRFGKKVVDTLAVKSIACQSCPIACAHWVEVKDGPYAGLQIKDLEITPVATFGAQCGLDTGASIKASEICQRLGMDMVSSGSTVAMAVQLFQEGLLTVNDVGYTLRWGDNDAILQLLFDIAEQRGIGKVLGQGTYRAAKEIEGAESFAMQIKGMEIPMIDPRGRWSTWTLGIITNLRGGDHLRCRNPVENLRFNENSSDLMTERFGLGMEEYKALDMPKKLKYEIFDLENDTINIPIMSKWSEDLINLFNSVGICIRPPVMNRIGPSILAEAFSAFTGIEVNSETIMDGSERSWNLIKLFNLREGEDIKEYKFPLRFYEQQLNGKVLDYRVIEKVLEKYLTARGWNINTGDPTLEKLKELELDTLIEKSSFTTDGGNFNAKESQVQACGTHTQD